MLYNRNMAVKRGLGKGLDALIPSNNRDGQGVIQISITSIKNNPWQPRSRVDTEELAELAESIRKHGILQPIVVTRSENSGEFILIAGQRRLQAASIVDMHTIPAIIRETPSDSQMLELALIENIQRSNLNALETARAYQALSTNFNMSHEEISKRVGKSRTSISNTLRLLKLSKSVQKALSKNQITEGHARAIVGISKDVHQEQILQKILNNKLNVRQSEQLVKKLTHTPTSSNHSSNLTTEETDLENLIRNTLGTKVNLQVKNNGSGKLTIYFFSDEELDSITQKILAS